MNPLTEKEIIKGFDELDNAVNQIIKKKDFYYDKINFEETMIKLQLGIFTELRRIRKLLEKESKKRKEL